jgi:hypothetical protein
MITAATTIETLLATVRRRFYPNAAAARSFHRDRRTLAYALSWPAAWLDQRGLSCTQERYQNLVLERLEAIAAHGDPERYGAYFPAYLLKTIQDWFTWHGEDLYNELKHARNAMEMALIGVLTRADEEGDLPQRLQDCRQMEILAETHRTLAQLHRSRHPKNATAPKQLKLKLS